MHEAISETCIVSLPESTAAIISIVRFTQQTDEPVQVGLLSGKDTFPAEQRAMFTEQGSCLVHVVVTTPGRLVNHLRETEMFTLQHLRFLVSC